MRFTSQRFRGISLWLGTQPYADVLKIQHSLAAKLLRNRIAAGRDTPDEHFLLLCEHKPVYTVGLRHSDYSESEEVRLKSLGAEFFRTDRGGLITFHGLGQLVAYPILDLDALRVKGIKRVNTRRYVELLEEVVIRTMKSYNLLDAKRTTNTGVWVGDGQRKIAAIGVNVKNSIATHGVAVNCNVDLSWFRQIVPCGLLDKEVTSMTVELNRELTVDTLLPSLNNSFSNVFNCDFKMFKDEEGLEILRCNSS